MSEWVSEDQGVDFENTGDECQTGWPFDIVGLLALLTGLLVYFQYTTLDKFKVLRPAVRYVFSHDAIEHITSQVLLDVNDAIVFFLICVVFLSFIFLELWRGRVTVFLGHIFKTERRTIGALLVGSLILLRFYFARGVVNWSGDGSSHICYSWLASVSFAQGEIPIWTNYLGSGSPYLQFYGFLFFYLVGFLNLFVGQLDWAIKMVLAGAHVVSGVGMYFFVRRLCGSRRAGFVAGLGFVLCMWHTQQTLIMGRFPLSLFYALLPWPFYFLERLRFGSSLAPAVIGGGLILGLLAFVHPGYAFWTVAVLGLYIGVRVFTARMRIPRLKFAWCGLVLWASGIVFGAYLTLPMWVERALVDLDEITHSGIPDPTWGHLFVWSNYRIQLFAFPGHDHWYGGYLGLSLVFLAGIGLFGCIKRQTRSTGLALALCFVASLILVVGYRWPGIRSLDLVKAFNAGRYLLFVTFFLAAMAGVGTVVLRRFFRPRVSAIMTWVVLMILTDLGATTFQHPYVLANKTFLDGPPEFYARLRAGSEDFPSDQIPNFRLSYPMDDIFYLLGIAWYTVNSGIPSFLTGYREGPRAQTTVCLPLQKLLEREFRGNDLSAGLKNSKELLRLQTGLYLLNIRNTFVLRQQTGELVSVDWKYYSPIVVAPEIAGLDIDESSDDVMQLETLIDAMGVWAEKNTCQRILLKDLDQGQHLNTVPEIEILKHSVWNQHVELKVKVSAPCFARLAYAHYPHLGVYVDGERVESLRTAGDFIAVKLGRGEHLIALKPHLSPLRRTLLALDIVLLAVAGVILGRGRAKSKEAA